MTQFLNRALLALLVATVTACGGGSGGGGGSSSSGGGTTAPAPTPTPGPTAPSDTDGDGVVDTDDACEDTLAGLPVNATGCTSGGVFADSPVTGLEYIIEGDNEVRTTDDSGAFHCVEGQSVSFMLGGIDFGSAQCQTFVTPADLSGCPDSDPEKGWCITNKARLLLSFAPANDTTRINISSQARSSAQGIDVNFNVDPANFEALNPEISNLHGQFGSGRNGVTSADEANNHLACTIEDIENGREPDGICDDADDSNDLGNGDDGGDDGTVVPDPGAPVAAPTNFNAAYDDATQKVNLTWNDSNSNEQGYLVYRRDDSTIAASACPTPEGSVSVAANCPDGFLVVASLPENSDSYSDSDIVVGDTYTYFVSATSEGGTEYAADPIEVNTALFNAAENVVATYNEPAHRIDLSWGDISNVETGYRVERDANDGNGFQALTSLAADSESYSDSAIDYAVTYVYRIVTLKDADEQVSASSSAHVPAAVLAPTGLGSAFDPDAVSVTVSWTDNSRADLQNLVQRRVTAGSFATVETLPANATQYLDSNVDEGTDYEYRVIAKNGNHEAASTALQVSVPEVLAAATNLSATQPTEEEQVSLSWTENSAYETSQSLERRLLPNGDFTSIANLGVNAVSYLDANVERGRSYEYRVLAVRGARSVESAAVSIGPLTGPGGPSLVISTWLPDGAMRDSDHYPAAVTGERNEVPELAQAINAGETAIGSIRRKSGNLEGERDNDDFYDWYVADLAAGDRIDLTYPDSPGSQNADLYIYNDQLELVDGSMAGNAVAESVTIPADGRYYIELERVSSADVPSYSMAVVAAPASANAASIQRANNNGFALSDDFHTEKGIIVFKKELGAFGAAGNLLGNAVNRLANGRVGIIDIATLQGVFGAAFSHDPRISRIKDAELMKKYIALRSLREIREYEDVEDAHPDAVVHADAGFDGAHPVGEVSVASSWTQWTHTMGSVQSAWPHTRGANIEIAVIDTGIFTDHPLIRGKVVRLDGSPGGLGYDTIEDDDNANPGSTSGSANHGTHVATIAMGSDVNGYPIGVAPEARLLPIRALGDGGSGSLTNVYEAFDLALNSCADVINMSIQESNNKFAYHSSILPFFEQAETNDQIVVKSAGNNYDVGIEYDNSRVPGTLIISSVGSESQLANYSNHGYSIDLAAPGGEAPDYVAAGYAMNDPNNPTWGYGYYQGTSQAAPFVAGVVALMKSYNQFLTNAQVEAALQNYLMNRDAGLPGRDSYYGWGIVDAELAVRAAADAAGDTLPEAVRSELHPAGLDFSGSRTSMVMQVSPVGGNTGTVSFLNLPSYVSVQAESVDANGYGTWRFILDAETAPEGVETWESMTVKTGVWEELVPVRIHNTDTFDRASLFGSVIARLINVSDSSVAHSEAIPTGSADGFFKLVGFDTLPVGEYNIVAGSDFDSDGRIDDNGEIYGVWGGSSTPESVVITGSETGDTLVDIQLQIQSP